MLDTIDQRGVEVPVRRGILVATLPVVLWGLGLPLEAWLPVSAQDSEARLVRGDGYQTREGLEPVSISAGEGQSCGDRSDGAAACWGGNQHGQAEPPSGYFSQVSAGGHHSQTANEKGNG